MSIRYFFHNFVQFDFALPEYNDWPKIKKERGGLLDCAGKSTHIVENQAHCPGFVWKNYGIYVDCWKAENSKIAW